MLKLKKLLAISFAALVFVLSSCSDATEETLDEMQDTIDANYVGSDPDEDDVPTGGGDPDEDDNLTGGG